MTMTQKTVRCAHCELIQYSDPDKPMCRRCHRPVMVTLDADILAMAWIVPEDERDLRKEVGARCQRLRKGRGWTQGAMARLLGVPRPYLTKLETGRVLPGMASLKRLAAAFGVPITELVGSERDFHRWALLADPFIAELVLASAGRLTDAQWGKVTIMAERLARTAE